MYSFNEESLKPYFSLENVKKGLFDLCKKIFNVETTLLTSKEIKDLNISTWNKDV